MKLSRIFGLLMLCAGLIAVGTPAIACCVDAAPKHECCPQDSQHAHHGSPGMDARSAAQKCCAFAASIDLTTADATIERHSYRDSIPPDPPLSLSFVAALGAVYSLSKIDDPPTSSPPLADQAPLYLRTGRLRL